MLETLAGAIHGLQKLGTATRLDRVAQGDGAIRTEQEGGREESYNVIAAQESTRSKKTEART